MAGVYWFRFTYPTCPDDLNENQKLRKYQILQHNTPSKSGYKKKVDRYSFNVRNSSRNISKTTTCSGYNPPSASDVPGLDWDLDVTDSMIKAKSILNNTHTIPNSGPSTWTYTSENVDTS